MKLERIIKHLEDQPEDRLIKNKNRITRQFLTETYPRLLNVGSDATLEAMVADCLDIDRKIRLAKQKHPELAGDSEEDKLEYEEHAKEELGYTHTP